MFAPRKRGTDVPVEVPLFRDLAGFRLFTSLVLRAALSLGLGERDRRVPPRFLDRMPARHADVRREALTDGEVANDALGLSRVPLVGGVKEESRAVARHDDLAAEPLAGLVVETSGAQALAERIAVALVVQLDFYAELVARHVRLLYAP